LGEGKDSERVLYRRNKIIEMVDQHVERMAETTTNLAIDSIQYAFVTSLEYGFTQLFPRHTKQGIALIDDLDEPLPTPAIRLTNINTDEKMQPDYPILLKDFPDELDRLVNDYERWQSLTNEILIDNNDSIYKLHSKNLIPTLNKFQNTITMFYAPWCHYSQLMLPKFSKTMKNINYLVNEKIINENSIALAKVNVDEEGEMKVNFDISTYPTLKIIQGNNKKIASKKTTIFSKELFPTSDFNGDTSTVADITSHVLSVSSWPKKLKYSNLISENDKNEIENELNSLIQNNENNNNNEEEEEKENLRKKLSSSLSLSFPIENFLKIIKFSDDIFEKENNNLDNVNHDEDDEDIPSSEKKRAIVIFNVFPDCYSIFKKSKLTNLISSKLVGNNKFITSISEKDVLSTLTQLPGDFNEQDVKLAMTNFKDDNKGDIDQSYVIVAKCESSSLLFQTVPKEMIKKYETSSTSSESAMSPIEESLMKWLTAASWPSIAQFNPSASQGERIQNSPVKNLCILFGLTSDFMFEEYKDILMSISNNNIGFAHYLYADYNEIKLHSILNAIGVNPHQQQEPLIVIVSMLNQFKPEKILGNKISLSSVNEMIHKINNNLDTMKNDEL
jgi:thiol-disulfide isomerase/thioredoxin